MGSIVQDLRYAARTLAKRPGFAAIIILTLALGIGANTAIFSVFNARVLRTLPYENPDRLVLLSGTRQGEVIHGGMVSYADLEDFRRQGESFEDIAALRGTTFTLSDKGGLERIDGAYVSAGFFSLLGVEASVGRLFRTEEDRPGSQCVAVVSDAFWQRKFAGDPAILGRTLMLDGISFTVVGVLPREFVFPIDMRRAEVWTTAGLDAATFPGRGSVRVTAVGRMKPNVTIDQAGAEMHTIAARLARQYPAINAERGIRLRPLQDVVSGDIRTPMLLLLGAVGLVLLIACANVASMLLARGEDRRTELAIRVALGASVRHVVWQVFAEGMLLACLGSALGLLVALWVLDGLVGALGGYISELAGISLDWRVLGFALAITVLAGFLVCLIPAVTASRAGVHASLKEGGRRQSGGGRRGALSGLQIAEVALALVLLVGAGLLLRSFQRLMSVDPGFDRENMLTFTLSIPRTGFTDAGKRAELYGQVIEGLEALPGVQSVGASTSLPLHRAYVSDSFAIVGRPPPSGAPLNVRFDSVSPRYFQTMGVPLLGGRMFTEQDAGGRRPAMIINETMSRRYWHGEDPLGQQVALASPMNDGVPGVFEIVGVVGDLHDTTLDLAPQPCMYVPYRQLALRFMYFSLRTTVDPLTMIGPARQTVATITKDEAPYEFASMQQLLVKTVVHRSAVTVLLTLFAALAMGLSAAGIYGTVAYSVAGRTHEIGVRMAVGARRGDVLRLMLRQGLTLAAIGLAIGLAVSVAANRLVVGFLYEIDSVDPATYIGVSAFVAAVASLACYVPARRAAKVDPIVALRCA